MNAVRICLNGINQHSIDIMSHLTIILFNYAEHLSEKRSLEIFFKFPYLKKKTRMICMQIFPKTHAYWRKKEERWNVSTVTITLKDHITEKKCLAFPDLFSFVIQSCVFDIISFVSPNTNFPQRLSQRAPNSGGQKKWLS